MRRTITLLSPSLLLLPLSLSLLLLLTVTGCDRTDPYLREGVWRPNGANAANLRAMVVVPADLVAAAPAAPADGGLAAMALDRLRHDRVRPLLDSGLAEVIPISGASSGQPGQSPTAAPPGAGATAGSGN